MTLVSFPASFLFPSLRFYELSAWICPPGCLTWISDIHFMGNKHLPFFSMTRRLCSRLLDSLVTPLLSGRLFLNWFNHKLSHEPHWANKLMWANGSSMILLWYNCVTFLPISFFLTMAWAQHRTDSLWGVSIGSLQLALWFWFSPILPTLILFPFVSESLDSLILMVGIGHLLSSTCCLLCLQISHT